MALTKTYTLTQKNFMCMSLNVLGKRVWIEFKGLRSHYKGTYTTDDPDIMEALEKCNGFGAEYVVTKTQGEPAEKPAPPAPPEAPAADLPKPTPAAPEGAKTNTAPEPTEPFKAVTGIKSVAKAREYLLENIEDMKVSDLSNREKVLAVSAIHKITFPDLI